MRSIITLFFSQLYLRLNLNELISIDRWCSQKSGKKYFIVGFLKINFTEGNCCFRSIQHQSSSNSMSWSYNQTVIIFFKYNICIHVWKMLGKMYWITTWNKGILIFLLNQFNIYPFFSAGWQFDVELTTTLLRK